MHNRGLVRGLAAVGVVGIGAGGLILGGAAGPASAFSGSCPATTPAATLVADGVCEVRMTSSGTFTPPAGIAKLAAVLVAAGGGAAITDFSFYGGDGGNILYVDNVLAADPSTPLPVVVGVGGAAAQNSSEFPTLGGSTTVGGNAAEGGASGASPQAFCGNGPFLGFGDGAQTAATGDPTCQPGIGYTLGTIPGADPALFPAAAAGTDMYSNGGNATTGTDAITTSAIAGTGGSVNATNAVAGSNGLVIFRFQATAVSPAAVTPAATPAAPELAATGADIPWTTPALALSAILGGALLMRRSRSQTR